MTTQRLAVLEAEGRDTGKAFICLDSEGIAAAMRTLQDRVATLAQLADQEERDRLSDEYYSDCVLTILVGWEGFDVPFTAAAARQLLADVPGFGDTLTRLTNAALLAKLPTEGAQ